MREKNIFKYFGVIIILLCTFFNISSHTKVEICDIIGRYALPENSLAILETDSAITLYDHKIFIILYDSKWSEDSPEFRMTSWGFGPNSWCFDSISNQITLNTDDKLIIETEILPLIENLKKIRLQLDDIHASPTDSSTIDSLKSEYDRFERKYIPYFIGDRKDLWGPLQLEVIDSNTLRIVDPIGLRQLDTDTLLELIRANPGEELYFKRY